MSQTVKGIIFLGTFFSIVIILLLLIGRVDHGREEQDRKRRMALIGNIEFKGKVINSKVYQFGGRDYYMICIKLDYCNVKDIYILNDICAIKIKDNVATMSAGFLNTDIGVVDRIEENMNHSGIEKYTFKNGEVHQHEFSFDSMGLQEADMDTCN